MGEMFNNLINQLNEFWSGLDKGQRIRLIIAAVLSITLVVSFVIYAGRPQMEVLYSNLSQTDAGNVHAKLKEMGINTKISGTTVYVPKDKVDELRAQLAMERVISDDFDVPQDTQASFFETSEDKKQRYLAAQQNKLKKGIRAIKGVDYVDVNLYIPDDTPFVLDPENNEATASLIVKLKPGTAPLDRNQVQGIVQYVAKSVKGLKPENVFVMDENGRPLVQDTDDISTQVSTQMEMQDAVRSNIEKTIIKFLEAPFGVNNVKVSVAVNLDFNSEVTNSTVFEAPDTEKNAGIVRNMQDIKKEWVDAGDGGVPGTDSNTEIDQYVETDTSKAQYNEASTIVNYEINEIKKQIVKEMGSIQGLTVSVLVNEDSLKEDAKANSEELVAKVKELVKYSIQGFGAQAVPVDSSINVALMGFDTSFKDAVAEAEAAEAKQRSRELMIMTGTGIAAVLVFGAAVFLLFRRRGSGYGGSAAVEYVTDSSGRAIPLSAMESAPIAEIDVEDKNEVKKKIEKFVGQKPETAAQLLKSWLNEE